MKMIKVVICFGYIREFPTHHENDDFLYEKFELESDCMQGMATDCVPLIKVACLEERNL